MARRVRPRVSLPTRRRDAFATLCGALAALAVLGLAPAPASATMEEYSTFDVAAREEDDESLLDHLLTRPPSEWRDEWERAPQAFRSGQGCLTSGQWFLMNDLKLTSPLGERARFFLGLRQTHSDAVDYEELGFGFRFPIRWGSLSAEFQPSWDKSRQDFIVGWEAGTDSSRFHVQTAFNVEDMFNNLWAWRQTRVGALAEPYRRHPYEPRLRVTARGEDWRAEIGGRWMRPSLKQVSGYYVDAGFSLQSLWGAIAWAAAEKRALGVTWEATVRDQQVESTDAPLDAPLLDHRDYRREWTAELAARRAVTRRLDVQLRGIYQDRTQAYGAGLGPGAFRGLDRLAQAELFYRASPRFGCRVGVLHDRIGIAERGVVPVFTYGSRKESRAYIGLMARFGRVTVQGIEGIELDHEPYEVEFHHDKGFLHLQTTF